MNLTTAIKRKFTPAAASVADDLNRARQDLAGAQTSAAAAFLDGRDIDDAAAVVARAAARVATLEAAADLAAVRAQQAEQNAQAQARQAAEAELRALRDELNAAAAAEYDRLLADRQRLEALIAKAERHAVLANRWPDLHTGSITDAAGVFVACYRSTDPILRAVDFRRAMKHPAKTGPSPKLSGEAARRYKHPDDR